MAKNGKPTLPVAPSADDLLAAPDTALGEEVVSLPELGFAIRVRGLTRGETRSVIDSDDLNTTEKEAKALALAAVEPTFTDEQALRLISEKSFTATETVLTKILQLSGLAPGFRS